MLSTKKLTKQTLLLDTVCKINCKVSKMLVLHLESWEKLEQYLSKTTLHVVISASSILTLDLPSVSDTKCFKTGPWI